MQILKGIVVTESQSTGQKLCYSGYIATLAVVRLFCPINVSEVKHNDTDLAAKPTKQCQGSRYQGSKIWSKLFTTRFNRGPRLQSNKMSLAGAIQIDMTSGGWNPVKADKSSEG